MSTYPPCPKCSSEHTYEDRDFLVCPECSHEWSAADGEPVDSSLIAEELMVVDSNGQRLIDGDTVTVIKDLKVKGASGALKVGTKVRSIRLIAGDHNIDCKIDGFGPMKLKSEFVKKA